MTAHGSSFDTLARARLASVLDRRFRLHALEVDAPDGGVAIRGDWLGKGGVRPVEGRGGSAAGSLRSERQLLLALAGAVAGMAMGSGLGLTLLARRRRGRPAG